jgi:hypothetical protein
MCVCVIEASEWLQQGGEAGTLNPLQGRGEERTNDQ